MVFLDAADRHNGCLQVLPGSHEPGIAPGRSVDGFGSFEMDPDAIDRNQLVALEVQAGSVAFFGARLVHQSLPNTSNSDRRTLLYSYQPAGRSTSAQHLARLIDAHTWELPQ